MADDERQPDDVRSCPNCGGTVVYRGVGRRPVWCSTRCRNDAALRRLGARKGAIEIRLVEVPRHRAADVQAASESLPATASQPIPGPDNARRTPSRPSPEQALRVIRNDPEAVGKLLAHLERRRSDDTLLGAEWLPVRNAIRLIASALPPGIERRAQ